MQANQASEPLGKLLRDVINLIRVKQWVKNGFVLAPLLFTGQFTDLASVRNAAIAFMLFCLASSATYVVNDLKDIERDRLHPKKAKSRPLAAGSMTPAFARLVLASIYAMLIAGFFLAPSVMAVIVGYLILNVAYTFF